MKNILFEVLLTDGEGHGKRRKLVAATFRDAVEAAHRFLEEASNDAVTKWRLSAVTVEDRDIDVPA